MLETAHPELRARREALVAAHYEMQEGRFISSRRLLRSGFVVSSEVSKAPMWNHGVPDGAANLESFLAELARDKSAAERRPALYLPDDLLDDSDATRTLRAAGWERFDRESWMTCDCGRADFSSSNLAIRRVEDEPGFEDFLAVFEAAYQAGGKSYRDALWEGGSEELHHFVGYQEHKPACVGTLIQRDSAACVYNVGTVPEFRRHGFARGLMEEIIRFAGSRGLEELFLQVDSDSPTERLYHKLGFRTEFRRTGFRVKEWQPADRSGMDGADGRRGEGILEWFGPPPSDRAIRGRRRALEFPLPASLEGDGLEEARASRWILLAWGLLLSRCSREAQVVFATNARAGVGPTGAAPCLRTVEVEAPVSEEIGAWMANAEIRTVDAANGLQTESAVVFGEVDAGNTPLVVRIRRDEDEDCGAEVTMRECPPPHVGGYEGARRGRMDYDPSVLSDEGALRLAGYLGRIMESLRSAPPGTRLGAVEFLSSTEIVELDRLGIGRALTPVRGTIVDEFRRKSGELPHQMAVVVPGAGGDASDATGVSYAELNTRSDRLAQQLVESGATSGQIVGVSLKRSANFFVALLGVWKAGGAVLPLDPSLPAERLNFMIEDAAATIVVSDGAWKPASPGISLVGIATPQDKGAVAIEMATPELSGENPAYVIYTSGSTGKPKGVVVSHSALLQHSREMAKDYGLSAADRVLQFSSFSFDAALEQIVPALLTGACLVLRGDAAWSIRDFTRELCEQGLTVVDLPPGFLHQLLVDWTGSTGRMSSHRLRLLIVGGESILPETVRLWRRLDWRHVRLVNAYGPTEATITATISEAGGELEGGVDAGEGRVPIGRPCAGRRLYVVDRAGHRTPRGVPGELWIGGPLLALGYLNRPNLTAERFVCDGFSGGTGDRMYRTGDLVRYRGDGQLEFLGRVDDQVKIRGFRVELGEVESALCGHEGVRQAAVVLRGDPAQLAAFVVARGRLNSAELKAHVRSLLPEYMAPSEVSIVGELPLLPGGKVDRKALATRPVVTAARSFKGPSEPMELRLQLVFEEVLRQRPVGVDVSFFEAGGDSLQALDLLLQLERVTGRTLPLGTLYQHSTVEGLARFLNEQDQGVPARALVPLQPNGLRRPLFLVHTTPGDVLGYGNLIHHLGADQPCFGLQSLGLLDEALCHRRVEEMAACYLREIQTVQPAGPYLLGGWCYGGIVSVEMAHQLRAAGERIGLLALLETVPMRPRWKVGRYYWHRLGCLLRMAPGQWRRYFSGKIRYHREARKAAQMRFRQVPDEPREGREGVERNRKLARLEHVYRINLEALKHYRSEPYPGRVTLFNASEADAAQIPDPDFGWKGLAREIEVHTVPGDHDTMLGEPHVRILAAKLRKCLLAASEGEARI